MFCPKYSRIYGNFRFTAAISNFCFNGLSNRVGVSTTEKFDPENIGVAAGILFLSALELEIHLGENSTPLDTQRKYFMLDTRRVNDLVRRQCPD
jgi:hypothetical protein